MLDRFAACLHVCTGVSRWGSMGARPLPIGAGERLAATLEIRFTWQPGEWREAYLLSSGTEQDRVSAPIPMGYLILGLMALGGIGDLLRALCHEREQIMQDSLWPVLLLVCVLFAVVAIGLAMVRRRERFREMPALPRGEQQVTVHELGWRCAGGASTPDEPGVRGWGELRGLRASRRVVALLTCDGATVGVPLRALSADQTSWLERLLLRKVPRRG